MEQGSAIITIVKEYDSQKYPIFKRTTESLPQLFIMLTGRLGYCKNMAGDNMILHCSMGRAIGSGFGFRG